MRVCSKTQRRVHLLEENESRLQEVTKNVHWMRERLSQVAFWSCTVSQDVHDMQMRMQNTDVSKRFHERSERVVCPQKRKEIEKNNLETK